MGTFHALCARILRRDGPAIELSPRFVIYDTDDQQTLMKQAFRDLDLPIQGGLIRPRSVLEAISRAKNNLESVEDLVEAATTHYEREVARIATRYSERLRAAGALDFDDLLVETVRLLETQPEVLARYQARWRYLHVDEYQDTNAAQYRHRAGAGRRPPQPVRRGRRRPVDLRLARRRPPQHPRLRARRARGDGGEARAELPEHGADPAGGPRGRREQRGPQGEGALDRARRRPADRPLRGLQRGGGGGVDRPPGRSAPRRERECAHPAGRRGGDAPPEGDRRPATGRTPSPARSRRRSCATGSATS